MDAIDLILKVRFRFEKAMFHHRPTFSAETILSPFVVSHSWNPDWGISNTVFHFVPGESGE